tara:strand:+ start:1600 stop:2022 length:423 start_codon:yes stop_codon:yes gene_type:complete
MKLRFFPASFLLLCLATPITYAKTTCSIESFHSIDIQPDTSAALVDKEHDQIQIKQKPSMRCANVVFTTSLTRSRVGHEMSDKFEATFFDNTKGTSHSISFDDDAVKAGYVRVGPATPVEAYVCFTTADAPIKTISCDVN